MLKLRRIRCAGFAATLVAVVAADQAQAQGRLEAGYTISVARISIGSLTVSVDIAESQYTITASGRVSGVLRVLTSGEGSLMARGAVKNGRPMPTGFASNTASDDDMGEVAMAIEDGNVTELAASPPPPSPDRVPLTGAHRRGIIDPLSALLVPAGSGGDGLTPEACQRTLPIFDGRRRFDLKLGFKRLDKVKADKGYAGPVVVCALTFVPIAGHRTSSTLIKYLSEGREIELVLAPIAGTRILAPFQVSVTSMLGNLVLQADRFEAKAATTGGAYADVERYAGLVRPRH